jgi:hypothetical protein
MFGPKEHVIAITKDEAVALIALSNALEGVWRPSTSSAFRPDPPLPAALNAIASRLTGIIRPPAPKASVAKPEPKLRKGEVPKAEAAQVTGKKKSGAAPSPAGLSMNGKDE